MLRGLWLYDIFLIYDMETRSGSEFYHAFLGLCRGVWSDAAAACLSPADTEFLCVRYCEERIENQRWGR